MSPTLRTAKVSPITKKFTGLADVMAFGFDQTLIAQDQMLKIPLDDIEEEPQVREEFEDVDQTLAELGASLEVRQLQNLVVRPNLPGSAKKYRLVIGGRRFRSAKTRGLPTLWALVADLTDAEAEAAQLAENIHRKNLTQLELAKRLEKDLEALGSTQAVLQKYNKSKGWLSKNLSILNLPPQAARLIHEHISADLEVVHGVRTIEERDPEKARTVVDTLKADPKARRAREVVAGAKAEVKPPRPSRRPPHEEPLAKAYVAIFEKGQPAKEVLEALKDADRESIDAYLKPIAAQGKATDDLAKAVIDGLRTGAFAPDGVGAFALVAFVHAATGSRYNLAKVFASLRT